MAFDGDGPVFEVGLAAADVAGFAGAACKEESAGVCAAPLPAELGTLGAMGAAARIAGVMTGVGAVDETAPAGKRGGASDSPLPMPPSTLRPTLSSASRAASRSPCRPGLAST